MRNRYDGDKGKRLALEQLNAQRIVEGNDAVAQALLDAGELMFPQDGNTVIEQGSSADELYFILTGAVEFSVNGRTLGSRGAGRTVGEMSAIHQGIARTATIKAKAHTVLLKVDAGKFNEIAVDHPVIWKRVAADIAERLEERNATIRPCNERPKVFIICAVEALRVAQAIQFHFQHDEADFKIWSDQVFKASQYPIEALQDVLDESDFSIAIASPEDLVIVRRETATQPRDNVLVELGMSLGRLGRRRSMLLVPRKSDMKLPTDFKGLTPIQYDDGDLKDLSRLVGPACFEIRTVIEENGVRTDR